MLTESGVKLLDFGLAKQAKVSPEQITTITTAGVLLGAFAYMSPEQAQGQPVDARSDIFSFGCVLYEMAAGRRAFTGNSPLYTLTAIFHAEPEPLRKAAPRLPRALDDVVGRCLRKPPAKRYQTMAEVRSALRRLNAPRAFMGLSSLRSHARLAIGVILIMIAAFVLRTSRNAAVTKSKYNTPVRVIAQAGRIRYPAISPDGKLIAYASDREGSFDIYVQQVGGTASIRLTSSGYDETAPCFTPDGTQIVFQSNEKGAGIQVISTLGGKPRRLASEGYEPKVSPNGRYVLYWNGPSNLNVLEGSQLYLVPFTGGQPRRIHAEFASAGRPIWSDDESSFVFVGNQSGSFIQKGVRTDWWIAKLNDSYKVPLHIYEAALDDQQLVQTPVPIFCYQGAFYGLAHIGYVATLIKFNTKHLEKGITATRVLHSTEHVTNFSISGEGLVAFVSSTANTDLYRLRLNPATSHVQGGVQRLTDEPSRETNGSLSDDGRLLAYASNKDGSNALWVRNLENGTEKKITDLVDSVVTTPMMSPDGRYVAFCPHPREPQVVLIPTSGGEPALLREKVFPYRWLNNDTLRTIISESDKVTRLFDINIHTKQVTSPRDLPMQIEMMCEQGPAALDACQMPQQNGTVNLVVKKHGPDVTGLHLITTLGSYDQWLAWVPRGNALYWYDRVNGIDGLYACKVDPDTGRPLGSSFLAFQFRTQTKLGELGEQNMFVRNDSLIISMTENFSTFWLQQIPATN